MGDAADGQQVRKFGSARHTANQKSAAACDLVGFRLVRGGTQRTALVIMQSTSSRASSACHVVGAAGEAGFEQRVVKKLAGIVAEKRPPGAIGAFESGRQPDDEKPRRPGAE